MTRRAVGFDCYYSGQAQHLIDWTYRQRVKQGKIIYLDATSQEIKQAEQDEAIFKAMDMTGQAAMALTIVVGAICVVFNIGRAFGWWG